jgi:hypothetical protein
LTLRRGAPRSDLKWKFDQERALRIASQFNPDAKAFPTIRTAPLWLTMHTPFEFQARRLNDLLKISFHACKSLRQFSNRPRSGLSSMAACGRHASVMSRGVV